VTPSAVAISAGSINLPKRLIVDSACRSDKLRRPIRPAIRASVFAAIAPIRPMPRMIGPASWGTREATGCTTGPPATTGKFAEGCVSVDRKDEPTLPIVPSAPATPVVFPPNTLPRIPSPALISPPLVPKIAMLDSLLSFRTVRTVETLRIHRR
jgi:hypothetical protein